MSKRRFNKVQILKVLKSYEEGVPIPRIIEDNGISQATFYNWKAKYGSSSSTSSQEFNKLKEENERLKRMFADLSLENLSLKAKLKKNEIET